MNIRSVSLHLFMHHLGNKWEQEEDANLHIYFLFSSLCLLSLFSTYSAWGLPGCVEGRGQRGQREVECCLSLLRQLRALIPYALSPAGQRTLRQLNLGTEGHEEWHLNVTAWMKVCLGEHQDKQSSQTNVKEMIYIYLHEYIKWHIIWCSAKVLTTLSELSKTKLNSNKDSERNMRQGSCQELECSRTVLLFQEHPIEGDKELS